MKRTILFLLTATITFSCLLAQTSKNPFLKLGYKKHISYTSSKGEFEEFHGNPDVVEIGTIYYNTKTKKVVGYVNEEKENAEVATATSAMSVDPLCEKYYWITPYAYCLNNPVNAIDPDGKRVFFVGGANNDRDGWNYINRWRNSFTSSGISGFTRMNVTRGKSEDIAFTTKYRNSGTETYFKGTVSPNVVAGLSPASEVGTRPVRNEVINDAVNQIKTNLANNPLKDGEQLNLGGYSYGSVVQAQAALKLAVSGTHIDNLILIGSPISTNSELYKQLSENTNIGNIIRVDIPNDGFSNPKDMKQFLYGIYQSVVSGDNAPHFDLARPGANADNAIKAVTDWLKSQGVK